MCAIDSPDLPRLVIPPSRKTSGVRSWPDIFRHSCAPAKITQQRFYALCNKDTKPIHVCVTSVYIIRKRGI